MSRPVLMIFHVEKVGAIQAVVQDGIEAQKILGLFCTKGLPAYLTGATADGFAYAIDTAAIKSIFYKDMETLQREQMIQSTQLNKPGSRISGY